MTFTDFVDDSTESSNIYLTRLYAARLGAQVRQVDVGLPAIDDGVGILTGSLCRSPVRHRHLATESDCSTRSHKKRK